LLRCARNDGLEDTTLTKQKNSKAFDKIKAGLEDMRRYLDGSADKSEFRVHAPNSERTGPTSLQAQPPENTT
jgi:hypothetical protein